MTGLYSFAVKVWHPFRDAAEIATKLGMVATHSHVAGSARATPAGRPLDGSYAESYCCFYIAVPQEQSLDVSLRKANVFLARDRVFVQRLRVEGARLVYSISFQPGYAEESLDPEVLGAVASLGFELSLSVHDVQQKSGRRVENTL